MNNTDAYQSWLERNRNVDLSAGFANGVLQRISLDERRSAAQPGREMLPRWLEWVAHRPLVQAALLVVALVAGASRLAATWLIILSS
jgi:hypothetical protein